DGILALESEVNNEENDFLKKGLSMAIDGSEPDTIRELLEIEMEQTSTRHKVNGSIFNQWAGLAGAMGMVGTLIGLVAMLLNMADPSAIGPSMAVALLTTMYGAIIGNVFGTPIYNILTIRNDEETKVKEMILSGIMSIQSGDAPRVLEAKLLSYMAPNERVSQFD
ncbi:motility protein A, partial [Sulfurovum sp. bin170]|uniref:motility protein A n=1 Tax=Sulfurovum sp. bin170 TaxID=2695268 RepID=UPI001417E61B